MNRDESTDLQALFENRYGENTQAPHTNFNYQPVVPILGRRSIRAFSDRPLPEGMLDVLLACSQSAPSKSDLQQYSVLVIENDDTRAQIAGRLDSMPWLADAAVLLLFCGDIYRNRQLGEHHALPHDNDNVDSFMNAAIDAALAMQSYIHAAERLGLGCCPISMVRNHIEFIADLCGLPDGVFPIAGLACGWPAASAVMSQRLPQDVVVHRDRYQSDQLVEKVLAHDEQRRVRAPITEAKQRHVKRYGVKPDIGWSENIARQLSVPERDQFRAYLNKHGFALR